MSPDERWMGAALALASRGKGRTAPNPNVGCVIVSGERVVGRGWTQAGGRPHAEAMALTQAGEKSRGATLYVTLEPCAHVSARGPACADLIAESGVARVVAAMEDPDERTAGGGFARLRAAGIEVTEGVRTAEAVRAMAGFLMRQWLGRPHVTLKLATSLDGRLALADGSSRWITREAARAHAHLERARVEAIVVGRGTWEADQPRLDVRLDGLEERNPRRLILSRRPRESGGPAALAGGEEKLGPCLRGDDEVEVIESPQAISALPNVDHVLVEGGAGAAASFLRADLVDRLLLYRAPILIGDGLPAIGDVGLADLSEAHGQWEMSDARMLGSDRLEVYERVRASSGKVGTTFPPG